MIQWREDIENAKKPYDRILILNDRGVNVVLFDPSWTEGGWWLTTDGKEEYALRGSAPTHWAEITLPEKEWSREEALKSIIEAVCDLDDDQFKNLCDQIIQHNPIQIS